MKKVINKNSDFNNGIIIVLLLITIIFFINYESIDLSFLCKLGKKKEGFKEGQEVQERTREVIHAEIEELKKKDEWLTAEEKGDDTTLVTRKDFLTNTRKGIIREINKLELEKIGKDNILNIWHEHKGPKNRIGSALINPNYMVWSAANFAILKHETGLDVVKEIENNLYEGMGSKYNMESAKSSIGSMGSKITSNMGSARSRTRNMGDDLKGRFGF
jgi:hypothetical protein